MNVILEQLVVSYDEKPFEFSNTVTFSGLSVSYPLGLFDNLGAIVFYDWTNDALYNFVNWHKQFNKISLYLMAFWNPEELPDTLSRKIRGIYLPGRECR